MNKLIICLCLCSFIYAIDMNAAVSHLKSHAKSSTTGWCAAYVADTLEAGGFRFQRQGSAYQYRTNGILVGIGYKEIPRPSSFQKGDITVTEGNGAHPHGHMAMWSGTNWISDFVQNSEFVYRVSQPPVHYFRYGGSSSSSSGDNNHNTGGNCQGKSIAQVAREVLAGKWGNGDDRRNRLINAGCNYNAVQNEVNRLLS